MDAPANWSVVHAPAAATQAVATKAAVTGFAHACTGVTVCIVAIAAQGDIVFNLRDGGTGAGTILWTGRFAATAGTSRDIALTGLNLKGTRGTAMTLESAAAPAGTNFATVTLTGRTEPDA